MPRNIEVKAILQNRDATLAAVAARAGTSGETIVQHDVFFPNDRARLKLRVLGKGSGELIQYERENLADVRCSHYQIARTSDPEVLLEILTQTLGRAGEVKKRRTLYFIGQTRVHIDQVEGLGDFLELEVVLRPEQTEAEGRQIAEELLAELEIQQNQLVAEAYVDLLSSADSAVRGPHP
jgi:predicted adenylyl cyclase CyaB